MSRWIVLLSLAAAACTIPITRTATVEPGDARSLRPGSVVTVNLVDGSRFDATFVRATAGELVVRRRGTFTSTEVHYPVAQVKSVNDYSVEHWEWLPGSASYPVPLDGFNPLP
jgi:hypothetical protein